MIVRLSEICLFVADSFHWTGHYKLWLSGIHHRDVSAFNLMYKRREDGTIVGVLIDFDLAILCGSQSTNTERTGTMVFMALEILDSIAADTHRLHLYRHDAESFLWVAIWVCGTYEGGKARQDASFKAWTQGDARHCRNYKQGSLGPNERILWSKGNQAKTDVLREIREHLDEDGFKQRKQQRKQSRTFQASGGVVQPEVPERPQTDHNKINDNPFRELRAEL